jgi:pyruvate/2-oxoglutarate dehydrogenase complex dihydrolipoamide acyltransferase (E2) component
VDLNLVKKGKLIKYNIQKFLPIRRNFAEQFEIYEKKHYIHILTEFDITKLRSNIEVKSEEIGENLSLTAYLVKSVSNASSNSNILNTFQFRKRRTLFSNDIDISVIIERLVDGELWPISHIIREVNKKSFYEVHNEIRKAQIDQIDIDITKRLLKRFFILPFFLRKFIRKRIQKSPILTNKYMGSLTVTALGMFGLGRGWFIPNEGLPLIVTIGGIFQQPTISDNDIKIRDKLCVTLSFDRDKSMITLISLFISKLRDKIESAIFLEELA